MISKSERRTPAAAAMIEMTAVLLAIVLAIPPWQNAYAQEMSSSGPGAGVLLLHSTLDDPMSVTAPMAGTGGTTTLDSQDFVPAQLGHGASFTCAGCTQVMTFPVGQGETRNINLDRGELQFWYQPDYPAAADNVAHTLVTIGSIYSVPRMVLAETDRLWFAVIEPPWTPHATSAGYRAPLWEPGEWVHVRAVWDNAHPTDSLRVYLNGTRVDQGGVPRGWTLDFDADSDPNPPQIYVGSGNPTGDYSAQGILDELTVTEPRGNILLRSALEDPASIITPMVGLGGNTTLVAPTDFVPGQAGNAAQFTSVGSAVSFPAADGSVQNIELDRGDIEFWYRPNYDAAADDVIHALMVVGGAYSVPRLALWEGDRLGLAVVTSDWQYHTTSTAWRAPVWTAGQWVHVRAEWDSSHPTDSLRVYVNGARVDAGGVPGGWTLGTETDIGSIFIGSGNDPGYFPADGVIDEVAIRGVVSAPDNPDEGEEPPPC